MKLVSNLRLFQNNKKTINKGPVKVKYANIWHIKSLFSHLLYLFFLDCCQTVDVSSCALSLIQLFKCELISARLVVIICGGKQEEAGRHRTWWMAGGGREVRGTDVMCGKRTVRREEAGYRLSGRRTIGGARERQQRGTDRGRSAGRWIKRDKRCWFGSSIQKTRHAGFGWHQRYLNHRCV